MNTRPSSARLAQSLLLTAVFMTSLAILPNQASAADLVSGKRHYTTYCASCHGYNGISLRPQTPNLANGEGMAQPDFALVNTLRSGFATHPPFLGILNDRELLDVVSYVRTIR